MSAATSSVRSLARVVVNPAAGRATAMPRLELGARFRTVVERVASRSEAVDVVQQSARRGELVVVAGGDGSLHTAVNALGDAGLRAPLGLVPLGTANDLARDLGMPLEPAAAAWAIGAATPRAADLLTVDGRRCVVGGGFGLPGDCIETVSSLRARSSLAGELLRLGGSRAYQAAAPLHVCPAPTLIPVEVRWTTPEGHERGWSTDVIAGFFLNQPTIGRGLLLAPGAERDDGVFELAFIRPSSSTKLLTGLWKVSVGRAAPGQVVVVRAVAARLTFSTPQMVFADGEPQPTTRSVDIGLLPGALSLMQ